MPEQQVNENSPPRGGERERETWERGDERVIVRGSKWCPESVRKSGRKARDENTEIIPVGRMWCRWEVFLLHHPEHSRIPVVPIFLYFLRKLFNFLSLPCSGCCQKLQPHFLLFPNCPILIQEKCVFPHFSAYIQSHLNSDTSISSFPYCCYYSILLPSFQCFQYFSINTRFFL